MAIWWCNVLTVADWGKTYSRTILCFVTWAAGIVASIYLQSKPCTIRLPPFPTMASCAEDEYTYSMTGPTHTLLMWQSTHLSGWKCRLNQTTVSTMQHHIATFFDPWFFSFHWTRPHAQTANVSKRKLERLDVLPQSAYNPDLAPSDYHNFRPMGHFLRRWRF